MRNKHRHKSSGQHSFLGEEDRLHKIDILGDPLRNLREKIDWEAFRPLLNRTFPPACEEGGRPSYDFILMFKILILQRYTNLSDEQMEYQINDRNSFRRFLGLCSGDDVPDAKTIWHFRERVRRYKLTYPLFRIFFTEMKKKGLIGKRGRIVDASFVEVPRQRNSVEENKLLKQGQIPEEWKGQPNKLAQKDLDARWTKKNKETYYGFKNNIKADVDSKMVMNFCVSAASVHDSQAVERLLNKMEDKGCKLYADSAYVGQQIDALGRREGMIVKICLKGFRNHPLSEFQKKLNKMRSHIRARIEHIFGFQANSMRATSIRTIGIERAEVMIGLNNLTYNMFRFLQIT